MIAQRLLRLSRKVALANMKHEATTEANKMTKLCLSYTEQGTTGMFTFHIWSTLAVYQSAIFNYANVRVSGGPQ